MDNYTEFDGFNSIQRSFVKMALDEYNSEQNWTDLGLRYWTVIDERLGGNLKSLKIT
jgi:hypothetical protein